LVKNIINMPINHLYNKFASQIKRNQVSNLFKIVLQDEKSFLLTILVYAIFIGLLSLAVPISVQLLINSVAFTALLQPILILGFILFLVVTFSSVLNALQFYITEIFQRRFFARFSSEIVLKLINVNHQDFEKSNQTEFINRFFDVFNVQKIVPKIFTKTFANILQSLIGLILVAFYHWILLLFALLVLFATFFIWQLFAKKCFIAKFATSKKKYDMASWFEDIARNHLLFKSNHAKEYAINKTENITKQYLQERKKYFYYLFFQVILTLILYTFATSALLIVGGYLVLNAQLSLGQLVASELIISAVLYNISQLGGDLESIYELASACEKLSQIHHLPKETLGNKCLENKPINIQFNNVIDNYFQRKFLFNVNFEAGKKYLISSDNLSIQKLLIELIAGLRKPLYGSLEFNQQNISDLNFDKLRNQIAIIDNRSFIDGTIYEYLTFNQLNIDNKKVNEVLDITQLKNVLHRFDSDLSLPILPSGWPLSESEKILLRVAKILIDEPKVIIITEVLDMLSLKMRNNILQFLTKNHQATILYFSNRRDHMVGFDSYLFFSMEKVFVFNNIEDLNNFEEQYE
jgi:putative ABC transport system ATP-binding protein